MSKSNAHTPAPWHLGKDAPIYKGSDDYLWSLHVYAAPRSKDDDDTQIAWVCCRDDGSQDGTDAPRLAEARANARLIAAAPEMLAALKIFLGKDRRFQVVVGGNPIAVNKMLVGVHATIAKATGSDR